MNREKYETCKHSTGNVGELIVYVKETCPNYTKIHGRLVSSKIRCQGCEYWKECENENNPPKK